MSSPVLAKRTPAQSKPSASARKSQSARQVAAAALASDDDEDDDRQDADMGRADGADAHDEEEAGDDDAPPPSKRPRATSTASAASKKPAASAGKKPTSSVSSAASSSASSSSSGSRSSATADLDAMMSQCKNDLRGAEAPTPESLQASDKRAVLKTMKMNMLIPLIHMLSKILGNTQFKFTRERLVITQCGPNGSTFVNFVAHAAFFDGGFSVTKPFEANLSMKQLWAHLRSFESFETITMTVTDQGLTIQGHDKKMGLLKKSISMPTCDIAADALTDRSPKAVDYRCIIQLNSEALRDVCKEISDAKSDFIEIAFDPSQNHLSISAESQTKSKLDFLFEIDEGSAAPLEPGEESKSQPTVRCKFSTEIINDCMLCAKVNTAVRLYLGTDKPIVIEFMVDQNADDSDKSSLMRTWVASKMKDDEAASAE